MRKLFGVDGLICQFLQKTVLIIIINVLWLLCCIPVVTAASSTAAMYYTIVKVVRRDRSCLIKEFFSSFLRTLKEGVCISVATAIIAVILFMIRKAIVAEKTSLVIGSISVYDFLFVLLAAALAYIIPNLSRFEIRLGRLLKMTFFMCIKHLPVTAALVFGTMGCVWLVFLQPVALIAVLPGVWCFASTFLMEPVLMQYTPEPEKGVDAWYYE